MRTMHDEVVKSSNKKFKLYYVHLLEWEWSSAFVSLHIKHSCFSQGVTLLVYIYTLILNWRATKLCFQFGPSYCPPSWNNAYDNGETVPSHFALYITTCFNFSCCTSVFLGQKFANRSSRRWSTSKECHNSQNSKVRWYSETLNMSFPDLALIACVSENQLFSASLRC